MGYDYNRNAETERAKAVTILYADGGHEGNAHMFVTCKLDKAASFQNASLWLKCTVQ